MISIFIKLIQYVPCITPALLMLIIMAPLLLRGCA